MDRDYINHLVRTADALLAVDMGNVDRALELLLACHNRGGIVYICGNGGSAATASHFACDLQKAAGVRAVALTDNVPLITAWANDKSYSQVFLMQLERLAREGDILFIISCSGTSQNVLGALWHKAPMFIIELVGKAAPERVMNFQVRVNSSNYGVIENVHLAICHALTVGLRERLTTTP